MLLEDFVDSAGVVFGLPEDEFELHLLAAIGLNEHAVTHGKHRFELNQSRLPDGPVLQQLLAIDLEIASDVLLLLGPQVLIEAL